MIGARFLANRKPLGSLSVQVWNNFKIFDSNSRVLVFGRPDSMSRFNQVLAYWRFSHIVYIATTPVPKVYRVDFKGRVTSTLAWFPDPKELFQDSFRDMQGDPLVFATINLLSYERSLWVKETARLINASAVGVQANCPDDFFHCLELTVFNRTIDITLESFWPIYIPPDCSRWITDVYLNSEVILVPKGRPYNVVEIFLKPFSWAAWSFLVLTMFVFEAINCLIPSLFKNDPILLSVCGFERSNLHNANRWEKFVFLPLILFIFVMSHSYESKIISFMIEKPSLPDIQTTVELVASGLKIKVDMAYSPGTMNNSLLGPSLVNSSEHVFNMDGIHAYVKNFLIAETLVHQWLNFNFELQRPRYFMLKERQGMFVGTFPVGIKTPLREVLWYTQKVFFEAGLISRWKSVVLRWNEHIQREAFVEQIMVVQRTWLRFEDLVPAWIALIAGLTLGAVAFAAELLTKMMQVVWFSRLLAGFPIR